MKISATLLSLALLAATAAAQTASTNTTTSASTTGTSTTATTKTNTGVTARQRKQQKRIGEGIENGSLTAGEASSLEHREAGLQKEKQNMRKADGGTLDAADKAKLEKQENGLSRSIYREKHDAQTQPKAKGEVETRDRNQQKRIGEGVENGSLTAGEAANLEHKDAKLQREEHKLRQKDGGSLDSADKAKVNRQQNAMSRNIYAKKHNRRRR